MPIKLDGIGHCAIAANDMAAMAHFYQEVLGFRLLEEDPDHGGIFLNLAGTSHTIDLFPMGTGGTKPAKDGSPLMNIAFKVSSYRALREAHDTLIEHGVAIRALRDHVSQRSIYFSDPEGTPLEIYYEKPNWAELFANGRGDDDGAFSFDSPAPGWE